MGLFAPFFLLGAIALAGPLYFHLLRRQTTTPRPFSSLMFFEPRTQASMRHRRLRYWRLLALRLALLALLALAFANPYVLRPAASVANQRLTLLVVDRSFSMRAGNRLAQAKAAALARLAEVTGRAQVRALGTAAPVALELFSDFKQSSMPASFSDLQMPGNIALAMHPVGEAGANWTIASVQAPARVWGSPKETKPARVEAVVAGYKTPAATLAISLRVNGQAVGTQRVTVPASGSARVVFDALAPPYGWSRGEVRIENAHDALPADDAADFTVQRADPARVLLVHSAGDARSPLYFSAALAANTGDAAYTVESVSAAAAAERTLANYAFVVLSDLPAIPPGFDANLAAYLRGGGGVLAAAGSAADGRNLGRFASGHRAARRLAGDSFLLCDPIRPRRCAGGGAAGGPDADPDGPEGRRRARADLCQRLRRLDQRFPGAPGVRGLCARVGTLLGRRGGGAVQLAAGG